MADVQGFSQASGAQGLQRVAWLSLGFVGVILTVYHTFSVTMSYLKHPFVTKFSLVSQDGLVFPFVALSTTRVVNCEKLEKRLENRSALPEKSFRPHCWLYHSSKCEKNRLDLIQKCNATVRGKMVEWTDDSEPNVQRSLYVMKTSWKEAILHHSLDFVVECKWNGKIIPLTGTSCDQSSFCVRYYQGSWQFFVNYKGKLMSSKLGEGAGLEITLKVPQTNPAGFGVINDMDGFIIEFVPPKYISGAKRIVVQPGASVSIGLQEVQHKKLPAPFESRCIHSWNETFFGQVTETIRQNVNRHFISYHQESCHAICRIKHLAGKCNCTWTKIDPKDFANLFHAPKCEEYDSDQLSCLTKNDLAMKSSRESCNCQEACEMISYDVTVSSSKWPSIELWLSVGQELGLIPMNYAESNNHPINQTITREEVADQLARIKIFFQSNQRTIIEQNPKFESFLVFFTTWGGALSIYLGISVMTLIGLTLSCCEIMVKFMRKFDDCAL